MKLRMTTKIRTSFAYLYGVYGHKLTTSLTAKSGCLDGRSDSGKE
jgi:hypothetical protein